MHSFVINLLVGP